MTLKELEDRVARLEEKVNLMYEIIDIQTKYNDSLTANLKLLTRQQEQQQEKPKPPCSPVAPGAPGVPLQRIVF
jgi:hypothetical protein